MIVMVVNKYESGQKENKVLFSVFIKVNINVKYF